MLQPIKKMKMRISTVSILIISICWLSVSCQNEDCNCEIDDKLLIENDSLINSILNQPENGFGEYWKRFDEPILNNQESESYRLSVVVLLYDFFKIYRIEKTKNQYNLHIKEYAVSTTTTYREDSLVNSFTREISKSQWDEFKDEFKKNCFWTMPVDIKEDDGYLDGSGWVLEAGKEKNNCTNSDYHFVYRHSPSGTNNSSKFIMICEKFMEFDSLNIRDF